MTITLDRACEIADNTNEQMADLLGEQVRDVPPVDLDSLSQYNEIRMTEPMPNEPHNNPDEVEGGDACTGGNARASKSVFCCS